MDTGTLDIIWTFISSAVTIASILAKYVFVHTTKDDEVLGKLKKFLSLVAINSEKK